MPVECRSTDELVDAVASASASAAEGLVSIAIAEGVGLGVSVGGRSWCLALERPVEVVARIEGACRPRWMWWSNSTPTALVAGGVRPARCWDIAAVHRLLFGGWRDEPQRVWCALHELDPAAQPGMGQLDLLGDGGGEGFDTEDPVRPDGYLRPEWTTGGWAADPLRLARWAETAARAQELQRQRIDEMEHPHRVRALARSESAAELLCVELAHDGLPVDVPTARSIISSFVGPQAADEAGQQSLRRARDAEVLRHAPPGWVADLRNPAHVRSLLRGVGVDVADTRAWRLEQYRSTNPLVDALLTWRKAERMETTFGYGWLAANVAADDRLRGAWSGSDGAAGRMTALAGLHNMPADLRPAVAAEPGWVFVHADLGQIEPRVLATVSGDPALLRATREHDMYAPVAAQLGVDRPTAKIAVLAAMYGQTSGAAGQALRGMEIAYPVAMQYLRDADDAGKVGTDLRTYGGRLIRMWQPREVLDGAELRDDDRRDERAAFAARGRFARNAMVQGAAAELFKAWAATVRARLAGSDGRIVLCLHDELLVHVRADQGETVARLVEACLHEAAARWAPDRAATFVADATVITRWSEAKG